MATLQGCEARRDVSLGSKVELNEALAKVFKRAVCLLSVLQPFWRREDVWKQVSSRQRRNPGRYGSAVLVRSSGDADLGGVSVYACR